LYFYSLINLQSIEKIFFYEKFKSLILMGIERTGEVLLFFFFFLINLRL
jgi:hypothetical protein